MADSGDPAQTLVIDWLRPPTTEPHPDVVWRLADDPGDATVMALLEILFAPRSREVA